MKKMYVLMVVSTILLTGLICYGQTRWSTDRLTSSALIYAGRAVLYGALVETNGTNNATLIIYDNTTNSGKVVRKIIIPGANYYGGFELPVGLECSTGIYATLSGTDAAFWITFRGQ